MALFFSFFSIAGPFPFLRCIIVLKLSYYYDNTMLNLASTLFLDNEWRVQSIAHKKPRILQPTNEPLLDVADNLVLNVHQTQSTTFASSQSSSKRPSRSRSHTNSQRDWNWAGIRPSLINNYIRSMSPSAHTCQNCDDPLTKWRCFHCDAYLCDSCNNTLHSRVGRLHIRISMNNHHHHIPTNLFEQVCIDADCTCVTSSSTTTTHSICLIDFFGCRHVKIKSKVCSCSLPEHLIGLGYFPSSPVKPHFAFSIPLMHYLYGARYTSAVSMYHFSQQLYYFHQYTTQASVCYSIKWQSMYPLLLTTFRQFCYVINGAKNLNMYGISLPYHSVCPCCASTVSCLSLDACMGLQNEKGSSHVEQVYTKGVSIHQRVVDEFVTASSRKPDVQVKYLLNFLFDMNYI